MLNLCLLLEDSAREVPDRPALVFGDLVLTYAQVDSLSTMLAGALAARGIGLGDRVALSSPNVPMFPIAYYAILKTGAAVVPLNVLLKAREIAYHLEDSRAKAYLCFEGTPELPMGQAGYAGFNEVDSCEHFILMTADPAGPSPIEGVPTLGQVIASAPPGFDSAMTPADATAVVLYTSGTTGKPKGAELTHSNMVLNARLSDLMYDRADHDVHLVTLPLFHSFGQSVQLNAGFYNRSTLVLLARFTPEAALSEMQRNGVTVFAGVPTMYWALLNADTSGYDLDAITSKLRLACSGGSALPADVLERFETKYGVPILEGYGLSETSPVATFNRIDRVRKPGSVGLPVWGVSIRVVDEKDNDVPQGELGEICIKGHNIMKGYLDRPEATAEAIRNGWFHTGDIGRFDEDGYLYIADRVKDMVIRGGFNVYPREIEEVLMTHPEVSLAAVIGVPDDRHGEEIKAFVVRAPGATVTEDELVAWSKKNMADYKYPRMVEFRDELPMNATGKILKRELR